MARTPAYLVADSTDGEQKVYLMCGICDDEIVEGDDFIAMVDAHDVHADVIHGEGV